MVDFDLWHMTRQFKNRGPEDLQSMLQMRSEKLQELQQHENDGQGRKLKDSRRSDGL